MRTIEIKDRSITVDGRTLRATWTDEAADDMRKFHGLDIYKEVAAALLYEINFEMNAAGTPLTEEENEHYKVKLLEFFG